MSEEHVDQESPTGFSTYGLITIERLLAYYSIRLAQDDLLTALKTSDTFYHQLIRLPLRNVFNGIILQQARDYQLYAQKLYIDYLVSGESGKDPAAPGASVREDIENERNALIQLGEEFHALESKQNKVIAESQTLLVQHASDWSAALQQVIQAIAKPLQKEGIRLGNDKIAQIIFSLLVQYNLLQEPDGKQLNWSKAESVAGMPLTAETKAIFTHEMQELQRFNINSNAQMGNLDAEIAAMNEEAKRFRSQFHEAILRANNLLKLLPDYQVDAAQNEANRQELNFDPEL